MRGFPVEGRMGEIIVLCASRMYIIEEHKPIFDAPMKFSFAKGLDILQKLAVIFHCSPYL